MEWLKVVGEVSAAGAVIAVIHIFLKHMARERRLDREQWTNHLSKAVEAEKEIAAAQERTAIVLDLVARELRTISDRLLKS